MKKNSILLILFIGFNCCYGIAPKVENYHYILNKRLITAKNSPLFGMEFEFSTNRIYTKENEFRESRLFTGDNKDFISYKIIDNVWYWKNHNKWNLLFDCTTKKGGNLLIVGTSYKIKLIKEITLRDVKYYKISLINKRGTRQSSYFFDPNKGVVIITTPSGVLLVREDCFDKPLSDDEQQIL
jgi:hypothetical protein